MRFLAALLIVAMAGGCGGGGDNTVTPDTTPPRVVSTSPADGDTTVPIDAAISVTFNEEMDRWSFTSSSFLVSGGVSGSITYTGKTATLTPAENLDYNVTYTSVIDTSVIDAAGNRLDSTYLWSFRTTPGVILPLAVNNRWEFLVITFVDNVAVDTSLDTMTILRDTVIQSETWFIDDAGRIYANRADGLWKLGTTGQPYLFLQFPTTTGAAYSGDPSISEEITVRGTSTLISVPEGFHSCHWYEGISTNLKYEYYYFQNLGPVMINRIQSELPPVVITSWQLYRATLH